MRILLYGVLGLLFVAVGGALVAPSLIDWNPFKRDLAIEVKAATGREVEIAGNLDLALLPSPHLVADRVRIANAPGAATPDMARIKSLRVDVRFWPLLAGRVEVETLRLVEPAIELERMASGHVNWDFSAAPAVGRPTRETGMSFDVDRLIVEGGTVTWRDAKTNRLARAEKVDAEVTATSLGGPFRVSGRMVARGTPATVEANLGVIGGGGPSPISLRIGTRDGSVEFTGTVTDVGGSPRLAGRLKGDAANFARAADLAGAPKALAARLSFTAELTASEDHAALKEIDFELGAARGRGACDIALSSTPRIAARLDVTRATLGPWLEAAVSPSKSGFVLPDDIAGTLDLSVQLVEAKGGPLRDLKIAAALDRGILRLDRVAALAPGGTTVTLGGLVAAKDGKAEFDLVLEAVAAHLRGLLDAVGLDTARVPADRLLTASLTAKLKGNPDKFDIQGIDARFDGARLVGGVTVVAGARPGIGASLAIDRLDLDAYLAGDRKDANEFWNDFDANLRVTIARLAWRATRLEGVKLDVTLQGGALTVREASARDIDGVALKLAGAVPDLDSPKLALDRIEATVHGVPVTGSGTLDLTRERPKLVAKLSAGDIVLKSDDTTPPGVWSREAIDFDPLRAFDADMAVDAPSLSWRRWRVTDAHGAATLENGTLEVSEIAGKLFAGAFNLSGRIVTSDRPTLDAKLRIEDAQVGEASISRRQSGLDLLGGTMTFSADLSARGESPFALVSTLQGTAGLAVRDGTVKGFDLPVVSDRLKQVDDPLDVFTLGTLFSAGETKFASLRGTFKVEDGQVRTEDLTLVAPTGAGSASAAADIARWNLDAKAEFILTELKDSPPVTVKFDGTLDDPRAVVNADALRQWAQHRNAAQKEREKPIPVAATPKPESPPAAKAEPKVEAKPEAKAEPKPEPKAKPKPEAKTEPKPAGPPPPDGKALTRGLLDGLRP